MAYRTVLAAYRGDPGFFSGVGRFLGGVARTAVSVGSRLLTGGAAAPVLQTFADPRPSAGPGGVVRTPGLPGMIQRALPGGRSGYMGRSCLTKDGRARRIRKDGQCYKRPSMNPMNPKAARRAITRIKSARKLLQSIERGLPRRAAKAGKCSCRRGR